MKDYLAKLFEYNFWANSRILEDLRKLPAVEERIGRIFGHILIAEEIWITRLHGDKWPGGELFPDLPLRDCEALIGRNRALYSDFLEALTAEELERVVSYVSTEGTAYHNPVSDILLHVAIHGGYHRGQIASETRNRGRNPLLTDFIVYCRE